MKINLIRGLDRLAVILIIPVTVYFCLFAENWISRCGGFVYSVYVHGNAIELSFLEGNALEIHWGNRLIPVDESQTTITISSPTPESSKQVKGRFVISPPSQSSELQFRRVPDGEVAQRSIGIMAYGSTQLEQYARISPRTKAALDRAYLAGGDLDGALVNGRTYCAGLGPDRVYLMPRISQRLDIRFLKALGFGILIAIAVSVLSRIVALTLICLRWLLTGAVDLTLYCLRWVLRGFVDKEIQKENVNIQ